MTHHQPDIQNWPEPDQGLLTASILDGRGGGRLLSWNEIEQIPPACGPLWMHMDYGETRVQDWLKNQSGLDPIVVQALISEDPRPRSTTFEDGLLLVLRGVNLNTGADPEDMVSLRIWVDPNRILTLRNRKIMAVNDVRIRLEKRCGPQDLQELLIQIIECLLNRIGEVILELQERVDVMEEKIIQAEDASLRKEIADLRRLAISMRRYIAPQKEAMLRMITENTKWMEEVTRMHLREFNDRLAKFLEDLEAARDRASVTQEELSNRNAEKMNRAMYLISIFTVIFLPLGLLTGLLGINVGGVPGEAYPNAFWVVCGLLVAMFLIQMKVFKNNKWF